MVAPLKLHEKGPLPEAPGAGLELDGEEAWAHCNSRRGFLIDKQLSMGLSPDEERELDQLQAAMDEHLDRVAPLPFDNLAALEAAAERIRLRLGRSEGAEQEPS